MIRKALVTLCAAALVGALAAPAGATNGMDMVGYGARAIGMGGADVAVDGDAASAAGGNPAVVSKAAPNSANVGLTVLMPQLTYEDPRPGSEVDGEDQYFPMPSLGYVHTPAASPWSFGVGLYAQGGMGVDFHDVMTSVPGRKDEMTSEVKFLRVNPLAAYKVNEDLSVGASVMLGYAAAKFSMFPGTPGGMNVDDLASFGLAGKVGAQYKIGPQWRVGLTYTTESSIDLDDGTATLNFGPQGGKVDYDAELDDFTWPQEVEFGVAYLPIKGLTLAADVKWINWSATIDNPKLKVSNPPAGFPATPFPGANGAPMGSNTLVFDMNWDDQWVWAIGAEYAINAAHTVRCGFNVANNPVPDDKLNPLFPAIPTTHLALGYGYTSGKWSIDAAYEHAFEKDQTNPDNGVEITHSQNTVSVGATYRY